MSQPVYKVVKQLSEAMIAGDLDARGEVAGLGAKDAETIELLNRMVDALIAPMRLAGSALEQIAHGALPPFVIDDYPGEFGRIKENINTLLAILYGLHGETEHLIGSIGAGQLKTRGNDWDYQGIWKELITGINTTLDSVIAPIHEAGEVLERLARYDLRARMNGRYRGEHAAIRKAMNTTAKALNDAIAQVSESVELVSEVGAKIGDISSTVSAGAENQSVQLNQTSASLATLTESATWSAGKAKDAHGNAEQATDAIMTAKESMNRMVGSMSEIKLAADSTASIADEIDGIARETGGLAQSAVEKAARMSVSAGGFGVVAQEIRKLSQHCTATAKSMKEFEKRLGDEHREEFGALIADLLSVARFSNLLGVNAAIEAAHVEGAANEFRAMTDEIRSLAARSTEAASKTGNLTRSSAQLCRGGVTLSEEINRQLEDAVHGARATCTFTDDMSQTIKDQTLGLEQINQTAAEIAQVTEKNAQGAAESLAASRELENQVKKLEKMVQQFSY